MAIQESMKHVYVTVTINYRDAADTDCQCIYMYTQSVICHQLDSLRVNYK